jgi:peptide/nickel transport system ATP-binding protein
VPLVNVRNLRVFFKVKEGWVRAVDGVNLTIDEAETVGLVGESGCGKTTLAYSISQLLPSNAYVLGGQVFFEGNRTVSPYRTEYWRIAEERMANNRSPLEQKLAAMPEKGTDSRMDAERAEVEGAIDALRFPLSTTYRSHLAVEIDAIERRMEQARRRAESGDKAARRALADAKARFAAASQEGDLIDLTRRPDGRLREYDTRLNTVRWKQISIVFQGAMNALNPVYTVGDQIVEAIRAHEDTTEWASRKRVEDLFRLVGIPVDRIDNFPHEYSGGMKQRAMIAMALALGPKLVIMDEPTTALDVITAAKIMDEVLRIQEQLKMTLLIISHDVSTVAKVADRICVMYAGQLVEESASLRIFKETLHPYTEGLLGAFPSVTGEKRRIEAIPGNPPSLVHPPSGCLFHPRCKYARDVCKTDPPPYFWTPDGKHRALCHFSRDFLAQGGLIRP